MLDLGSCLCKAGYGGDDIPKAIFPSVILLQSGASGSQGVAAGVGNVVELGWGVPCKRGVAIARGLTTCNFMGRAHNVRRPTYAVFNCLQHVGVGSEPAEANGMEVDGDAKAKASKRKLHVGQQAVNFRRDGMEVCMHMKHVAPPCTHAEPCHATPQHPCTCRGPYTEWWAKFVAIVRHSAAPICVGRPRHSGTTWPTAPRLYSRTPRPPHFT